MCDSMSIPIIVYRHGKEVFRITEEGFRLAAGMTPRDAIDAMVLAARNDRRAAFTEVAEMAEAEADRLFERARRIRQQGQLVDERWALWRNMMSRASGLDSLATRLRERVPVEAPAEQKRSRMEILNTEQLQPIRMYNTYSRDELFPGRVAFAEPRRTNWRQLWHDFLALIRRSRS